MAICSSIYNYFFNSAWKNYGYTFLTDVSEQEFARIISAASLFNSFGRLFSGLVLSYISFKTLYLTIVSLEIFNAFTIQHFGITYWIYMIYVCVGMFCLGSHKTMFPTMVTKTFGIEVGRKVYPIVYQCFSTASMIQYLIYKRVPKDKLEPLFHLFGGLCIFAFVLALLFQENKNWSKETLEHTKNKNGLKAAGNDKNKVGTN